MQLSKNMKLIDANIILRYLMNDHETLSQQAKEIIGTGNVYTKPEIIAEVVYVLKGIYGSDRKDTAEYINELLSDISCEHSDCVLFAMNLYANTSLDFVDCLLVAYHQIAGEDVVTFDKKLNRYLQNHPES